MPANVYDPSVLGANGIPDPLKDPVPPQGATIGAADPLAMIGKAAPKQLQSDKESTRRSFWDSIADKMHGAWENLFGPDADPKKQAEMHRAMAGSMMGMPIMTGQNPGGGAGPTNSMVSNPSALYSRLTGATPGGDTHQMTPAEWDARINGVPPGGVDQASGGYGAVAQGNGPVVRPGMAARGVSARGARPSSPNVSVPTGPASLQPSGSDPETVTAANQRGQDPMLAQLRQMYDKLDQRKGKMDLTPLAALTDAWTGSHFAQSYDRPLTDKQVQQMKAQLAENIAARQSQIQYHRDLIGARIYGADQRLAGQQVSAGARTDAAQIGADGRIAVQDGRNQGAAARQAAKPQPVFSPDEKALKSHFAPVLKGWLARTYDDPTGGKAMGGAVVEAHGQVMKMANVLMRSDPRHYPDLRTAYSQAVDDLTKYSRGGAGFTGLKPRAQNTPEYKQGGSDAD